jgi:trk system potassium uptake protein TrkH
VKRPRFPVVRFSLALGTAALVLAADVALASEYSAIAATLAMAVAIVALTQESGLAAFRRAGTRAVDDLLRLEAALVIGCAAFAAARTVAAYHQLRPGTAGEAWISAARLYDLVFVALATSASLVTLKVPLFAGVFLRLGRRPPLLLAVSFAALIVTGALLLSLPFAVHDAAAISLLDSLFTMTSAVCVTGLTVNEVGTTYTAFGQVVILIGMQFGGIGIMSVTAAALTLRRGASLRSHAQYASLFDADTLGELRGLVRTIVATTLAFEAAGTGLLWLAWSGDARLEDHSALWFALFHSVSAFCNAGFALFRGSLAPFASSPFTLAVIAALIFLGGIGFPVYRELIRNARARVRRWIMGGGPAGEFAFSTRVVLATSGILTAAGACAVLACEAGGALSAFGPLDATASALFTSITARTAGFSTVDIALASDATLLVLMALMFVGGSPGSTAGGIKTTALAVLYATFRAELRGEEPRLGRRAIPRDAIRRASAVSALSLTLVALILLALTLSESHDFVALAFEAFSAFGTVGLSTGITSELTPLGRLILITAMFVGRLGPMTIALAVGEGRRRPYRLPAADLQIW